VRFTCNNWQVDRFSVPFNEKTCCRFLLHADEDDGTEIFNLLISNDFSIWHSVCLKIYVFHKPLSHKEYS